MVSREELVFCADRGDGAYGWFWHEADVLVYALGQEVAEKKKTVAEAREIYEQFYDVEDTYVIAPQDVEWEKEAILNDRDTYTPEEVEELLADLAGDYGNFPLNEELDHLPNSSVFWQEAADLGIPDMGFSDDISPASGDVFEVWGLEALDTLRNELDGDYRLVVKEHIDKYVLSDSTNAMALIERQRRDDIR
jgi:hypothetical protein